MPYPYILLAHCTKVYKSVKKCLIIHNIASNLYMHQSHFPFHLGILQFTMYTMGD